MLQTNITGIKLHSISSTIPENSELVEGKRIYKTTFHQTTADLGFDAAKRLLDDCNLDVNDLGFLLFGSRTPDYRSPITAAVLQGRLNLAIDCICYDVNVGANAFAQLTQIGSSVLKNTNKKYGLIIFGDTPSKLFKNTVGNVFKVSDASTAVLLEKTEDNAALSFINISLGLYSDAIELKSGGFRNYDPSKPFDSTEESNFVVTVDDALINQAMQKVDFNMIEEFTKGTQAYFHSQYIGCVNSTSLEVLDDLVFADASELPILLASNFENKIEQVGQLSFVSIGEGLSIYGMKMNHVPLIIKTAYSDLVFEDFRISHEM
jgi:3-oxoacyl-[acyl-carrier-protein] synthase III